MSRAPRKKRGPNEPCWALPAASSKWRPHKLHLVVLQVVQTFALVIAPAVSLYALASTEVGRRREGRRERLNKVLHRVVDLMAAVAEWRGVSSSAGGGPTTRDT